jgi:HSP20 family protein
MFRKKKGGREGADDRIGEEGEGNRDPFEHPFFGRDPFEDFFSDFSGVERMMNDLMKNMFSGQGKIEQGKPYVYGFSMKTGPDGKPVIREFGNVKAGQVDVDGAKSLGPVVSDSREPLVDVVDQENQIIVIAEMPGVDKKDIEVEISGDNLVIKVERGAKKYYKEVDLPGEVKDDATDASYNNGVLEIKLKRKTKKKGKKIQIK